MQKKIEVPIEKQNEDEFIIYGLRLRWWNNQPNGVIFPIKTKKSVLIEIKNHDLWKHILNKLLGGYSCVLTGEGFWRLFNKSPNDINWIA